jgi:hypothetical protein
VRETVVLLNRVTDERLHYYIHYLPLPYQANPPGLQ